MSEFVREIFGNGKVTIPRELRALYNIQDGDLVTLRIVKIDRASGPRGTTSVPAPEPSPSLGAHAAPERLGTLPPAIVVARDESISTPERPTKKDVIQ